MSTPLRQLARHGLVFGVGAVVSRLASLVLLPLYTRHLTPSDYGIIAMIDLVVNLAALAAGAGVASAAVREHCADEDSSYRDRVWWTALAFVAVSAAGVLALVLLSRTAIANFAFGPEVTDGREYLTIAASALWIGTVMSALESYLRAVKASIFLTVVSFSRLLLNVVLNVWFVVGLGLGVRGILWGNLITTTVTCVVYLVPFIRVRGPVALDARLIRIYWRFGWPLVAFGLMSACMHEADRYLLRVFVSLHDVGLYSLGYQIGQGVNTLVIAPFTAVWGVVVYEVARRSDAAVVYAKVFRHVVLGLSFILLGAALFARPIISLLAPAEYAPAADIVPIVCLAYLFFSLHEHFKVPALVSGRTTALLPVVVASAIVNVLLNLVLIPRMGPMGAAWATVGTFCLFSFSGLAIYRRIAIYHYPLRSCGAILGAMVGTYIVFRMLSGPMDDWYLQVAFASIVWLLWGLTLFGPVVFEHRATIRSVLERYTRRSQTDGLTSLGRAAAQGSRDAVEVADP